MPRVKCNCCEGEYDTVQADGMAYFHRCPPMRGQKIRDDKGRIVIVPYSPDRDPKDVIEDVPVERANARNENPHPTRRDREGRPMMISEGLGVAPLDVQPVPIEGFLNADGTRPG